MAQIHQIDQRDRFADNLRSCLELIKCGEDYYRFMHLRSLKEQEQNAASKKPVQ